jgi:hypothetical protein
MKYSPPDSTITLSPASTSILADSGAILTLCSPGYVSFNTPTVKSEYGIGFPRIFDGASPVKSSAGSKDEDEYVTALVSVASFSTEE